MLRAAFGPGCVIAELDVGPAVDVGALLVLDVADGKDGVGRGESSLSPGSRGDCGARLNETGPDVGSRVGSAVPSSTTGVAESGAREPALPRASKPVAV